MTSEGSGFPRARISFLVVASSIGFLERCVADAPVVAVEYEGPPASDDLTAEPSVVTIVEGSDTMD
jgi:hypothetical protein